MAKLTDEDRAKRQKWYDNAPVCPACREHKVSVALARIGFSGLSVVYWKECDGCLPADVAAYSQELRASLLGENAGELDEDEAPGWEDERTCARCGCTDSAACEDPDTGLPCHWERIDDDEAVCSVCARKERAATG